MVSGGWGWVGYLPPREELREEDLEEDELERPKPPELLVEVLEGVVVRLAKERCDCLGEETIFARAACLLAFGDVVVDLTAVVPERILGDMFRYRELRDA